MLRSGDELNHSRATAGSRVAALLRPVEIGVAFSADVVYPRRPHRAGLQKMHMSAPSTRSTDADGKSFRREAALGYSNDGQGWRDVLTMRLNSSRRTRPLSRRKIVRLDFFWQPKPTDASRQSRVATSHGGGIAGWSSTLGNKMLATEHEN